MSRYTRRADFLRDKGICTSCGKVSVKGTGRTVCAGCNEKAKSRHYPRLEQYQKQHSFNKDYSNFMDQETMNLFDDEQMEIVDTGTLKNYHRFVLNFHKKSGGWGWSPLLYGPFKYDDDPKRWSVYLVCVAITLPNGERRILGYYGVTQQRIRDRMDAHKTGRLGKAISAIWRIGMEPVTVSQIAIYDNEEGALALERELTLEHKTYLEDFGFNDKIGTISAVEMRHRNGLYRT